MCFTPDTPPAPNYGQQTRDTLQAQVDLAPAQYAATSEYGPKYSELSLKELGTVMNGTATQPGLLSMANQATQAQREGDISAVETLGPRATAAFRAANPQQTQLLDTLNSDTMSNLTNPVGISPEMQRAVRAAQGARGMGHGPSDVYQEALATGSHAEALKQQYRQNAMSMAGINASTSADPFMAILGRPNSTVGQAQNQNQAAQSSSTSLFNPQSPYAQDLYNTAYNAQAASSIAGANNTAAVAGAGLSAL